MARARRKAERDAYVERVASGLMLSGMSFERARRIAMLAYVQADRRRRARAFTAPPAPVVTLTRNVAPAHERLAARIATNSAIDSESAHRMAVETAQQVDRERG